MARLEGELREGAKSFVCVRIVQMRGVDLSLFQFDWDQTWAAMFVGPDLTVYGRYGTRAGGRAEAEKHLSLASLRKAMERALHLHQNLATVRKSLEGKKGPTLRQRTVEAFPATADKFKSTELPKNCIHCHHAFPAVRRDLLAQRKPLPDEWMWPHPMPEEIGLSIDVGEGNRIEQVQAASAAEKGGIRRGDVLAKMEGQPILSIADVQWVLHRAPKQGTISFEVQRDGKTLSLRVTLPEGWRRYDITWRDSTWDLRPGMNLGELTSAEKKQIGIADRSLALQTKYVAAQGAAKKAGLASGDVLVEWDGKSDSLSESDFIALLRQKYAIGTRVPFAYRRGTKVHRAVFELD